MDSEILNQYQMVLSSQSYMDTNNSVWAAIPIINVFKGSLDELLQACKEQLKISGQTTKGLTQDKNVVKEQISIKVSVLSGSLAAYASVSGNQDLHHNGYITKSDVLQMRDVELPDRLGLLTDLLTAHLPALADYGVSEAQVTDLSTSVDDYRELIGLPRLKASQANLAKSTMNQLVAEMMTLLKDKMDKVMLQFQSSNPSFYEGYKRARVIVN